MEKFPPKTTRTVSQWTRHEVATIEATILSVTEDAYMSCTFGYDEPRLVTMGKRFLETLLKRLPGRSVEHIVRVGTYNAAYILKDHSADEDVAHFFMIDRESYDMPIFFVGATVKLVDAL
jgi:hypothetical protein